MSSIGLDVAYTKTQTDEVLVVVKDTAHHTETIVNQLTDITTTLADIQLQSDTRHPFIKPAPIHGTAQYLIPNRLVRDFIGREDILARITEGFNRPSSQGKPKIVTISGLGGQGKTQLSLQYCRRVQGNEIKAIFWVDAMSKELVLASFKKIVGLIGDPEQLLGDENIVQFVLEKLRTRHEPWLLIFDNHDDPAAFNLQDYFPGGDLGRILVTSRNAGVAKLDRQNAITLEGLSEPDALDLLFAQCEKERTRSNFEIGKAIVERLGYHTLAIAQAGSYILLRQLSLNKFMDTFEARKDGILKHTVGMTEYQRQLSATAKETTLNVFTTWDLSFELLKISNNAGEHKEDILTLFAFFDSKDISEELFQIYYDNCRLSPASDQRYQWSISVMLGMSETWSHEDFETVLVSLAQMNLIQPWYRDEEENCHISLHPLIRDWIRLRIDFKTFQECTFITANILASLIANFRDNTFEYKLPLSLRLALLSHVNAYQENYAYLNEHLSSTTDEDYANLYASETWFRDFLLANGWLNVAELMARRIATWVEARFGSESEDYMTSQVLLAKSVQSQGNYTEAESLLRKIIKVEKNVPISDNKNLNAAFNILAQVLVAQGVWEEAESINRRLLVIYERDHGAQNNHTLTTLHNLGAISRKKGQYDEAEVIYRRVLMIEERTYGIEHPHTLLALSNLALSLNDQGKNEEAEKLCRQALEIREKVLGGDHPDTMISNWNLARLLRDLHRVEEALEYFERAASLGLRLFGVNHPLALEFADAYAICKTEFQREVVGSTSNQALQSKDLSLDDRADGQSKEGKPEDPTSLKIGKSARCHRTNAD